MHSPLIQPSLSATVKPQASGVLLGMPSWGFPKPLPVTGQPYHLGHMGGGSQAQAGCAGVLVAGSAYLEMPGVPSGGWDQLAPTAPLQGTRSTRGPQRAAEPKLVSHRACWWPAPKYSYSFSCGVMGDWATGTVLRRRPEDTSSRLCSQEPHTGLPGPVPPAPWGQPGLLSSLAAAQHS